MSEQRIGDFLWMWAQPAGCHNNNFGFDENHISRIEPPQALAQFGIENAMYVVFGGNPKPPFDDVARSLGDMKKIIWSVMGDSSSTRNDETTDLQEVITLSEKFPSVVGGILDDFFFPDMSHGKVARASVEELKTIRDALHAAPRPLDLWAVVYENVLHQPIEEHLALCDGVTYWTWQAEALAQLDENLARVEAMGPHLRKMLGLYMWDYGNGRAMPLDAMQYQTETALRWLREGRIEGMIFLATCIADLDLEAVHWSREWIAAHADQPL